MSTRTNPRDDSGAAIVLVLVLVTAISLGIVALLSLSDTSIRSTVAMRDQAGELYAADAAAKVAIDRLRADTFDCDTANTLPLPNLYPATNTAPGASAAVRCTPDFSNGDGGGGANSSPGSAILTLGTGTEDGIYLDDSANQSVKVRGGIFSNSTIFLRGNKSDLENIATDSYVYALGGCSSDGTSRLISDPAPVCNYSSQPQSAFDRRGKDPGTVPAHGTAFDAPPAPTAAGTVTPNACAASPTVYTFTPGIYTDATQLNAFTDNPTCEKSVFHFLPGRYYFDFTNAGTHRWTVGLGHLVAGTPVSPPLKTSPAPSLPGACVRPGSPAATTSSGVQFVFGGDSRMESTKNGSNNANIEICASNSDSGPPIAVYGLKQAIGSGPMEVRAQTGCITATPYPLGGDAGHCAVIQTYADPNPSLTIQGTTYTPRSMLDLYLNNNTTQVFRWGLVSRGIRIRSTGSTGSLSDPVIDVPDDAPAPFALPNLMYLDVYLCPDAGTCGTTGPVRLRAKVLVATDPPRRVTVLSWNNQR